MKDVVRMANAQSLSKNTGSRLLTVPVLRMALAAALLSLLLFVLGCPQAGIAARYGLPGRELMIAAHLLAAIGNSVLLWAAGMVFHKDYCKCRVQLYAATISVVAYHLVAAVAYTLCFASYLYEVTLVLWFLKAVLCCYVAIGFLMLGDPEFQIGGMMLLLANVAGCPYVLPGGWATAQWIVAKMATFGAGVQLYWCATDDDY